MQLLYCPDCNNYLMAGDGECHDCHCGWKQPTNDSEDDTMPYYITVNDISPETLDLIKSRVAYLGLSSPEEYLQRLIDTDLSAGLKSQTTVRLMPDSECTLEELLARWEVLTEAEIRDVFDIGRQYLMADIYDKVRASYPKANIPEYCKLSIGVRRAFGREFQKVACINCVFSRLKTPGVRANLYEVINVC